MLKSLKHAITPCGYYVIRPSQSKTKYGNEADIYTGFRCFAGRPTRCKPGVTASLRASFPQMKPLMRRF